MKAAEFCGQLKVKAKKLRVCSIASYNLSYAGGKFEFLKIASKRIARSDKVIIIRAGVHGDEIAGPMTILRHIKDMFDVARKRGLKLILYPLTNPSGFQAGKRYNIDGDEGEAGNNDFMRYEMADGSLQDDLVKKDKFKKWHWSSDKKLKVRLPKETELMHRLLKQDVKRYRIVATIDLHQDRITPVAGPAAYFYAFGDLRRYRPIVKKIEKLLPILKNTKINAGFSKANGVTSNASGFIVRHDGSFSDLFYRLGVLHNLTVETTGKTPLLTAERVNLLWIHEIMKLTAS